MNISSDSKPDLDPTRNDSAWADNEVPCKVTHPQTSVSDKGKAPQQVACAVLKHDNGIERIQFEQWKVAGSTRGHIDPIRTTTANPFDQTDAVRVDDCVSPKTNVATQNPLSIPGELKADINPGTIASSATVVDVPSRDSDQPSMEAADCVESYWERGRLLRLLSYESSSSSSSEELNTVSSQKDDKSPELESPLEWMMADAGIYSASMPSPDSSGGWMVSDHSFDPSGSRKSSKFVRKLPHGARRKPSRVSLDMSGNNVVNARPLEIPRPARHFSYGATLEMPPIGIKSHRHSSSSRYGHVQVCRPKTASPRLSAHLLRATEAQSNDLDNDLSFAQRWIIGGLLVAANAVFFGSALFLALMPKIWNESRFAPPFH